jgi:phage-related protein
MIEEYKLSIYDCHENGAKNIKTKFENSLQQTCGLKLHVDNIIIIHLSNKWFHSSKAKCKIFFEIERSFYILHCLVKRKHTTNKKKI